MYSSIGFSLSLTPKKENDKIKSTKPVVEETPVPVAEKPKRVRKAPVAKVEETPEVPTTKTKKKIKP